MTETKSKIGIIVVVVNAICFGNSAGTITKVLSKPGAVQDSIFKAIGTRYPAGKKTHLVMCERRSDFIPDFTAKFLNKPAVYEHITDLRPATEEEKKLYRKSK